jgi:hypothetical protein
MLQRQQYSPMGGAPASPSVARSPHVARTPTPHASPAASPAPEHCGGGHHGVAPFPPGFRYSRPGLRGGAPVWPAKDARSHHLAKVRFSCIDDLTLLAAELYMYFILISITTR